MSFTFTKRLLQLLSLQVALIAPPAMAAQEIFVNVSAFEASVSVQALQDFGKTGKATSLLKTALARLPQEAQQQAQTAFVTRIEVDPVLLSNFLYTPQGETLLRQLGQILQSESGNSGFSALRAGLYQAAQDPEEGLTIANALKHMPGDRIRLNAERLLELAQAWRDLGTVSSFTPPTPTISEATRDKFPLPERLVLQNPGKFEWKRAEPLETTLGDRADLYLPEHLRGDLTLNGIGARPVIFIAHGLGGDRTSFTYLAEHFASHGFVVVVPEHQLASQRFQARGDAAPVVQANRLLQEDWAKKIGPQDFVQRPRTVTRLLDELVKRQQQDPLVQSRVDLDQVGVLGQSFGGYASLTLAGAQIDLAELARHCPADAIALNPSLALQCRAMGLGEGETDYRDPRIKAIVAINSVGSALFGPTGMAEVEVPVMMMAGSHDLVAPAHAEQLQPFQWLTHPDRYFAWLQGGTHFSTIQESDDFSSSSRLGLGSEAEPSLTKGLGVSKDAPTVAESHQQAKVYLKTSSLAFFQTHLVGDHTYAKFLTPDFTALLSEGKAMTLALVQELER